MVSGGIDAPGGIYARVYCILYCVYDVVVGKTTESDRQAAKLTLLLTLTLSLIWWRSNTVVLPRRKKFAISSDEFLVSQANLHVTAVD